MSVAGQPRILLYNTFWPRIVPSFDDCPCGCQLLTEPARLAEADAVIFHIPTLQGPIHLPKTAGQRWVGWSLESDVNYPQLSDAAFMRQFDLTMTYRQDADIWAPYFGPWILPELALPPRPKTEWALAAYFASNPRDHSGRNAYVRELMRSLRVDSFGACLRNRHLGQDTGRATKLATIARYKFTLAFENSITRDYVTEKFFDPLIAGSVPVYLGAPNVAAFAPGERCYVDVADFAGPKRLAEYLVSLGQDAASYQTYLRWKHEPLRTGFLAMIERQRQRPLCRLCVLLTGEQSG
jgi:Glycosyltransferase family 10 (fucosyltransferase) C-term/Fucosyltransferase, N-terminal